MNGPKPVTHLELAAHLEGEVTRARAAEIDAQLQLPGPLAETWRAQQSLVDTLRETPPHLAGANLLGALQLSMQRHTSPIAVAHLWARRSVAAGVAALSVAAGLLILPRLALKPSAAPVARASALRSPLEDQWVALQVFHGPAHQAPAPLGSAFCAQDMLRFSYSNFGPHPFTHLMVLGVDGQGSVHWYFPDRGDAHTNPSSLPIEGGALRMELPEMVQLPVPPGALTLYAVFSAGALNVAQVETATRGMSPGERLPLPGTGQHVMGTRVQPCP